MNTGECEKKRREQALEWMHFLVREGLERWFFHDHAVRRLVPDMVQASEAGTLSPTSAAAKILACLKNNPS